MRQVRRPRVRVSPQVQCGGALEVEVKRVLNRPVSNSAELSAINTPAVRNLDSHCGDVRAAVRVVVELK